MWFSHFFIQKQVLYIELNIFKYRNKLLATLPGIFRITAIKASQTSEAKAFWYLSVCVSYRVSAAVCVCQSWVPAVCRCRRLSPALLRWAVRAAAADWRTEPGSYCPDPELPIPAVPRARRCLKCKKSFTQTATGPDTECKSKHEIFLDLFSRCRDKGLAFHIISFSKVKLYKSDSKKPSQREWRTNNKYKSRETDKRSKNY